MVILLVLALTYLMYTSAILLRNVFSLPILSDRAEHTSTDTIPKVSVCIPARNEEHAIGKVVRAACTQNYPNFEVLVLDDQSTDKTAQILQTLKIEFPDRLHIISGRNKPEAWLGKPFACHQLSEHASGDYLLFIDADTILSPHSLPNILALSKRNNLGFITVWPQQITETFWEKLVIPMVYFALLTLLPWTYTERKPRWMPLFFHQKYRDMFAAACGQCMFFSRKAYQQIGGHISVRDNVVEDVALSKVIKQHNISMKMLYGGDAVFCRMYRSHREIWQGFRKNFLAGFSNNLLLFGVMALLHIVVFILPIGVLLASLCIPLQKLLILMAGCALALIFFQRLLVQWVMNQPISYTLWHPIGVLWFQVLGVRCVIDKISGKQVSWKGRAVDKK